ncbi:hypothetical protein PV11_09347 [Exophiala sideris]|uniref:Uncharacterized protein n=1 Tax=Exophiala sideris TaxID=1016849 RepID=A0A0D1Y428_9EURO|nr:hypothetical protein PV11_09347 [Exophiala sideris]
MGVVSPSDDELEIQAGVVEQEEDESGTQWFNRLQEWHSNNNALFHTALDSHRRDMFASYPLTPGQPSMASIDEYIYTQRQEELCLHITPDANHPALSVLIPMAMQDTGLFRAFLAAAQSQYEWRRNRNPRNPQRSQAMIMIQNDAIATLQKRLAQPAAHLDDGLIMSVLHLMVADSCSMDLPALKLHLKGVRQILALRGGLSDTPSHLALRAILATNEFYIALGQYLQLSLDDLSTVPMQPITYVQHPFPSDVTRDLAKLPLGLAEAALSGQLSVRCMKMLSNLAQWAHLANTQASTAEDAMTRYCRLFCEPREFARDAVMLLLDLRRSNIPPGLEHVVCLGLAIIVRHLSGQNRTNIFDHASLTALMANVKAVDTPNVVESEVIIWLALVINWRAHTAGGVPAADDLLDYVLDSFPAARSWKGITKICRKFWWFGRFEQEWKMYWQRGLDRVKNRSSGGRLLQRQALNLVQR